MTFLSLLQDLGAGNTFLLYGGLNVLFIIFFLLFVPETKGVSLEKIESNLLSGLPSARSAASSREAELRKPRAPFREGRALRIELVPAIEGHVADHAKSAKSA